MTATNKSPQTRLKPHQTYETQQFQIKYIGNEEPEFLTRLSQQNVPRSINESRAGSDTILEVRNVEPQKIPLVQNGSLEWIPDAQAPFCSSCHKGFNWRFRRHHCRICGKVFCSNCSQTSEILINGEKIKKIVCKKDFLLHTQLVTQMNKQKLLLRDQVSQYERLLDSSQFTDNQNNSLDLSRRGTNDFGRQARNSSFRMQIFEGSDAETQQRTSSFARKKSVLRNSYSSLKQSEDDIHTKAELARYSTINKNAMDRYLMEPNQATETTQFEFNNDMTLSPTQPTQSRAQTQRQGDDLRDSMKTWIDKKLNQHMQQMIDQVIKDFNIDSARWRRMIVKSTQNAVQTIRPSSRLLNDSINFNSFIKIITLEYPNQDKCLYVNGVVFKKDVAHRRMLTDIDNPRILILGNSLGYVQDDDNMIDLSAEINQENYNMQIIMSKIQSINPHIIFVEHEASRLALETLFKDQRTVVTNVPPKMMKMIARSTQTIICPSTNLIDRNFIVGNCLKFRVEEIMPMKTTTQGNADVSMLTGHTSLMFLEGCQSKLGCSIVLSGPNLAELKNVRSALKKCLATARVFLLEREYLRFIRPDPVNFIAVNQAIPEQETIQNEPELAFTFDQETQIKSKIQERAAKLWDRTKDPEFKQLNSPFLYDKQMKRDNLVFEYFSLVVPNSKDFISDLDINTEIDESMLERRKLSFKENRPPELQDDKSLDEGAVRNKIKQMCMKPQKQHIQFYNEESDISLYQMIKKMANSALQLCENKECKKIRLLHTDYYYHNNGCVEVKYREEPSNQDKPALSEHDDYPISVFCFCNQCKSLVVNKIEVPTQMLEMSFYKLLEQFFYNQDIVAQGQLVFDGNCNHSFHQQCSMIFCYGPIKIMLSFEAQDEYVIDLTHFGTSQGIVTQKDLQEKAHQKFFEMQRDVTAVFYFLEEKALILQDWLIAAQEEFNSLIGPAISPSLNKMTTFIEDLLVQLGQCRDLMMKEVFGVDSIQASQIEEENIHTLSKRLIDKVSTEMQVNRVQMHVGRRISELLFLIRKIHTLVISKFLPKLFGKRSPFIIHAEQATKLLNQSNFIKEDDALIRSTQFAQLSGQQTHQTFITGRLENQASFKERPGIMLNKTEDAFLPKDLIKESSDGPSKRLKDSYLELLEFEGQLSRFQSITNVVSESSLLSCGFDQNRISVNPHDTLSLIAYALNSNLYIRGLSKIEYMQMQQNVKVLRERDSDINANSTEFTLKHFGSKDSHKLMIEPDVLNDQISMSVAESELLRENNCYSFVISGSTSIQSEMQIFNQELEIEHISGEDKQGNQLPEKKFFLQRFEEGLDLSFIEQPIPEELIRDVSVLEAMVERMKIVHQTRITGKRNNGLPVQSQDELDFAALALTGATLSLAKSHRQSTDKVLLEGLQKKSSQDQKINVSIKVVNESEDLHESQDIQEYSLQDIHSEVYHSFHKPLDFSVKIYFSNQFEALRKIYCGSYNDFVHSIFRSEVWSDNSGGKTKSSFLKSHDHKYVIKVVKSGEIKMFETMGDSYFEYMCRSFTQQCPTAMSKILGIFRIRMKLGADGKVSQTYCVLMENLLLGVDESVAIKYDLKGSERSRYVQIKSHKQVALDTNFLYDMKSRPIPLQFQMRRMLQVAIANDSLYLAQHQIIDYSLFLIIDPIKKTIRVGIIDYIQQYTIEKELESYIKQTVSNIKPTIIGPDLYKQRFRTAMDKYFVGLIPDENCNFNAILKKRFNAKKIQWFTKEQDLYMTSQPTHQNLPQDRYASTFDQ